MEDRLEARISAIENIQEEFRHDIREMKEQLAIFEVSHPYQIIRIVNNSSKPLAICHVELTALTCGSHCLQPHLLSWQHPTRRSAKWLKGQT